MALRLRYNNVLKKLYGLNKQFRVSMQLDRITQLHELLGRPMDNYGVIHVTGTNGKGSVCWKTATALHTQGYNVGLFSSPHIASFRERSRINMEMIEEEEVVSLMEELFALADRHDLQFSFFEMTTAFSLLHFARHDVDYAVLETGCGGRLDATNICAKPILTCITSIAIDHSTILGDTIPDICYHKAGIMKKGVPCIAGRRVPNDILEAYANECGATYVPFLTGADSKNASLDNFVDFDTENANLVRQMLHFANRQSILELSEHSIETGATSRPPYRLEVVPLPATKLEHLPKVVFDSAHNTDAFDRLFDSVYAHFSDTGEGTHSLRVRVVLGFSGEKDVRACLKRVLEHVEPDRIHFVTSKHRRAVPSDLLRTILLEELAALPDHNFEQIEQIDGCDFPHSSLQVLKIDDREGFQELLSLSAESRDDVLLVCGSMYALGNVRQSIGAPMVYDDILKV